jgi:ADP-glucose pyrophosphorylase
MGIYVFKRSTLLNHLGDKTEHMDFGGDVIPSAKKEGVPSESFICFHVLQKAALHPAPMQP